MFSFTLVILSLSLSLSLSGASPSAAELKQMRAALMAQLDQIDSKLDTIATTPAMADQATKFVPMSYLHGMRCSQGTTQRQLQPEAAPEAAPKTPSASTARATESVAAVADVATTVAPVAIATAAAAAATTPATTTTRAPATVLEFVNAMETSKKAATTRAPATVLEYAKAPNPAVTEPTMQPAMAVQHTTAKPATAANTKTADQKKIDLKWAGVKVTRTERALKLKALKAARKEAKALKPLEAAMDVPPMNMPEINMPEMDIDGRASHPMPAMDAMGMDAVDAMLAPPMDMPELHTVDAPSPHDTHNTHTDADGATYLAVMCVIVVAAAGVAALVHASKNKHVRRNSFGESSLASAMSNLRSAQLPAMIRRRNCASAQFPGV